MMPVTGRYALIQINDVYLTRDGLSSGAPCKISIDGLDKLAIDSRIGVIKALSGKPYLQAVTGVLGQLIAFKYEQMEQSVYDDIVAIIQAFVTNQTAITLNVSNSPYGTLSNVSIVPDEDPVRHPENEFQGTSLKNGSFHFLTS
jgi:hypothetical protein